LPPMGRVSEVIAIFDGNYLIAGIDDLRKLKIIQKLRKKKV